MQSWYESRNRQQRNEEKADEVIKIIKKSGGEAKFLQTDVSIAEDVKALIDYTLSEYGEFQYAFNNSGLLGDLEPIASQAPDKSSYIVDVNIKGVIDCMYYQISAMIKYVNQSKPCSIINNSSILSHNAYPGITVYSATKHAVSGLNKRCGSRTSSIKYKNKCCRSWPNQYSNDTNSN